MEMRQYTDIMIQQVIRSLTFVDIKRLNIVIMRKIRISMKPIMTLMVRERILAEAVMRQEESMMKMEM